MANGSASATRFEGKGLDARSVIEFLGAGKGTCSLGYPNGTTRAFLSKEASLDLSDSLRGFGYEKLPTRNFSRIGGALSIQPAGFERADSVPIKKQGTIQERMLRTTIKVKRGIFADREGKFSRNKK